MKFLLYSLNYSPELTGIGKYNGEMCSEFAKIGLDVEAIVASPYYPEWKIHDGYSQYFYTNEKVENVSITHCPLYVPKNVTTLKRIIHLTTFAFTSSFALLSKVFNKPDVIFLVQPTLFCAPFVLVFAKIFRIKTILHIQDYEVDALLGLGMVRDTFKVRFAKKIEKILMNKFNYISTISYSMIENAKLKGINNKKLIHFPNWSDTEFVTPCTDGSALREEWGFNKSDKVVLYAGNIGNKQGLEIVLDAAEKYKDRAHVKFVIVGAGAFVEKLVEMSVQKVLTNVIFKPLQPWNRVPEMLALADIHLVVQKKGAADAVLPSKLTNILSAGGYALVTAEKHTELGQINEKYPGIYSLVEPENLQDFVSTLDLLLLSNPHSHNKIARKYAEEFLAKDKIFERFLDDLRSHLKITAQKVLKGK
jgi:colanic acid biosynthesis glycosyl transferase WcaI